MTISLPASAPLLGRPTRAAASPPDPADPTEPHPGEVGLDKTPTQHVGNAGFGLASLSSTWGNLLKVMKLGARTRMATVVPGLNLAVAGVEAYNAAHKLHQGEHLVAATSAGNAAGCLGFFVERAALSHGSTAWLGVGATLGLAGGLLGVGAGSLEIRRGLEIRAAGGGNRTLTMGVLDLSSGILSTAGAALTAAIPGPVGLCLMVGAGVCDLAGIGVDYLGRRKAPSSARRPGP